MQIEINNNLSIPNIKVAVERTEGGKLVINLNEESKVALGNVTPGSTVKIGNREFIVLGHGAETTAVITKEFTKEMVFDENSGDWRTSKVREYCNGEFYNELAAVIGKENIVKHTVNLVADDGTGKGITCKDDVSLLTTELYRRYREYLPAYGNWWWTATRVSHDDSLGYARSVCCVYSYGILNWSGCGRCSGVRPFCILNSSILVS